MSALKRSNFIPFEIYSLYFVILDITFNKTAKQSTTYAQSMAAKYAIDNKPNTYSRTNTENQPWWQVDLENDALVTKVITHSTKNDELRFLYSIID